MSTATATHLIIARVDAIMATLDRIDAIRRRFRPSRFRPAAHGAACGAWVNRAWERRDHLVRELGELAGPGHADAYEA